MPHEIFKYTQQPDSFYTVWAEHKSVLMVNGAGLNRLANVIGLKLASDSKDLHVFVSKHLALSLGSA